MNNRLSRFSIGMGDRFGMQGLYQMQAILEAEKSGVTVIPVWNKSNREHTLIGTEPSAVRAEADAAVAAAKWTHSYFVDADHINKTNVDRFIDASDFFTLDVADALGKSAPEAELKSFLKDAECLIKDWSIPGLSTPIAITPDDIKEIAEKYLQAILQAQELSQYILKKTTGRSVVMEVSMDETDITQTPKDILVILYMIQRAQIPVATIAPKFSGEFHKGVDYIGDPKAFAAEFAADNAVLAVAKKEFAMPQELKFSLHSGSDKFSLYPLMAEILKTTGAGLHLKTAGTTWLAELVGLLKSGQTGTDFVKKVYSQAVTRLDELCQPYAAVIHIDPSKLVAAAEFNQLSGADIVAQLDHEQKNPAFNVNLRQLMHIAFKIAAENGQEYRELVEKNKDIVGAAVADNLWLRHIKPLFCW